MKKVIGFMGTKLSAGQTTAGLTVMALALLSIGAASVEQLSVDYSTRACAQNVNFTGTFQVAGVAPASANTASAIVKRDGSGNFAAGTITANLTGTASANPTISSGTLVAMPLTNTKKIGDIYIDTGNANAYICCATGADTTGFKQINN